MRVHFSGGTVVQAYGLSGFISTEGDERLQWALYLDEQWRDKEVDWPCRFVDWPDFGLPANESDFFGAIDEAWRRARGGEVVAIACDGGTGRTGTAIACLAVLAGINVDEAVTWTRSNYHRWAVEVPQQEGVIRRFAAWAALEEKKTT